MIKFNNPTHKSRVIFISAGLVCLAVLGVIVWTSVKQMAAQPLPQQFNAQIINKTSALQVSSMKISDVFPTPTLEVKLKNISDKNITAYTLSIGGFNISSDGMITGTVLIPGQIDTQYISTNTLNSVAANDSTYRREIVIAAIFFEDGTDDGDPAFVNKIRDKHAAIKIQAGHVLSILKKSLISSQQNKNNAEILTSIESQTKLLPDESTNEGLSKEYRSGLNLVNQTIGTTVSKLKAKQRMNNKLDSEAEINEIITFYKQLQGRN